MINVIAKAIAIIIVATAISFNSLAQKTTDIPASVQSSFTAKYPQAQVKDWKTKNNKYMAAFKMNGKKYQATYAGDGSWIKTERNVKHRATLPNQVWAYIKGSKFASWNVDAMMKVNTPDKSVFEVQVDNNSGNPSATENAGSVENKMLYFDANGNLVKIAND